ncbi:signal transduction histidine kinase [Friedmanniella endophytica]|uniref:histidine kinase n=1 Tax=Microlunatus kandeliicorticis TaxID=1759536 RepID=A0A7W3P5F8_9ACTN|nr:ATP-binding protein [Microlunatus kandeliicorticis]MBA8793888.1 signal transduction histidine kinase [Microlunatus kandeliicorticis]
MIWSVATVIMAVVLLVPVAYLVLSRRSAAAARTARDAEPGGRGRVRAGRGPLPSVRVKITEMIRTATVCILALCAVGVAGSAFSAASRFESANRIGPGERANVLVAQQIQESLLAYRGYERTGDASFLAPLRSARTVVDAAVGTLDDALGDDAPISRDVVHQRDLVARFWQRYGDPALSGVRQSSADVTDASALVDSILQSNGAIAGWTKQRRMELTTISVVAAMITGGLLVIGAAVGLVIGLRPARQVLTGIAPPLENLERVVRRLQQQDFSARADSAAGVLEIRDVAEALNELAAGQERAEERAAEELRLTSLERDWGSSLHSLTEVEEILEAILVPLCEGLHARVGWVRVFPGTEDLPGRSLGLMYPPMPERRAAPEDLVIAAQRLARQIWRLQQSLVIYRDDAASATLVPPDLRDTVLDIMKPLGVASMIFAPLGIRETCLGYLIMSRTDEDEVWSPLEIRAINRMAREIGLAIGQARSFAREQQLVGELQALDARKNAFVSMVSHELRTPLSSVIGHLEIIRNGDLGPVDARVDRSLGAVERNTRRLTTLIEDLLLLSRIEENTTPTVRKPVDLDLLARESVQLQQPVADRSGITLRLLSGASVPMMLGDPNEIERVIDNLLSNAIKFSPRGGEVQIAVGGDPTGEAVELRVTDHGIGISPEDQRRLFTRFFRSTNPAAEAIPGTGLGLAICKLIVERNRGRISVQSELGRGTTMRVAFPVTDRPAERAAAAVAG